LGLYFDFDVHDVDNLHQLLAQQLALPRVTPDGDSHLTEFLALIRRHMQTMDVVRARGKDTDDFEQSSMPVLDQNAKGPDGMS
jgi:hypothetical protein